MPEPYETWSCAVHTFVFKAQQNLIYANEAKKNCDLSHFFSLIFSISGRISKHIDDGVHLFCKERGFPGVV